MGEEPKKDLTSLIELSAIEHANNPHGGGAHGGTLAAAPVEKITEEDFGDLEEMSKEANRLAHENPVPVEPEAVAPPPAAAPEPLPEVPALSELPKLEEAVPLAMSMNETGPGESPSVSSDENAVPSFMDDNASGDGGLPAGMELPSHSQMSPSTGSAPEEVMGLEGGVPGDDLPMEGLPEASPSFQEPESHDQPVARTGDTTAATAHEQVSVPIDTEIPTRAHAAPGMAPLPAARSQLDPNRPVVNAAPAGLSHTVKSGTPAAAKQDMAALKKFADKLSIGKPNIEGAPAFSMLASNANGYFDEKTIKAIENAITSEDFGIRLEDVAVQLTAGKLLVPQISEFAAITLAQKLRDVVDNIELDLASEIFKGPSAELGSMDESILMDAEEFETHHEEVHDMGAEPRNENDIFTTNLPELSEFQITRILSIVMCSEIMPADIAENPTTKEFEAATERLTEELVKRAFKLGAHGVLGINFTLKSIEGYKDGTGKVRRAYRMIGTGTAVRTRRRENQ